VSHDAKDSPFFIRFHSYSEENTNPNDSPSNPEYDFKDYPYFNHEMFNGLIGKNLRVTIEEI